MSRDRPRRWLPRPQDPDRVILRRAIRGTVVPLALFAFCVSVLDNDQAAILASFGAFALGVMADFSGSPAAKAVAYLATTAVGVVLVVAASLLSPWPLAVAAGMAFVVFCVTIAATLGGQMSLAPAPVILVYLVSATLPAAQGATGARLLGWLLAGVVSTLAALVLVPRPDRGTFRTRLATASRLLAAEVRGSGAPAGAAHELAEIRRTIGTGPLRPTGLDREDAALLQVRTGLERVAGFAGQADTGEGDPLRRQTEELREIAAGVLDTIAASLDGTGGAPETAPIEQARSRHLEAVEVSAAQALAAGQAPSVVVDAIDASFGVRLLSAAVSVVAANAAFAAGGHVDPATFLVDPKLPTGSAVVRAVRRLAPHLRPSSVAFQNAARRGMALGIAVLIAVAGRFPHPFWIGLGTLSVLRSNALGTGFTALQALLGVGIGLVLSTALLLATGGGATYLWAALPLLFFLSAYTPTALNYIVGQAMFTVLVVALFNVIVPEGAITAVVRVEDIAIGSAVAVAVGFLFWPRGAGGVLRNALADTYRTQATLFSAACARMLGDADSTDVADAAGDAAKATRAAEETLVEFMSERGRQAVPAEVWSEMLSTARHFGYAAGRIDGLARAGYEAGGCADAVAALEAERTIRAASLRQVEAALRGDRHAAEIPLPGPTTDCAKAAVAACLEAQGSAADFRPAMAPIFVRDWLLHADMMLSDIARPLAQVAATSPPPWWH